MRLLPGLPAMCHSEERSDEESRFVGSQIIASDEILRSWSLP